jgi:hypothetical protein
MQVAERVPLSTRVHNILFFIVCLGILCTTWFGFFPDPRQSSSLDISSPMGFFTDLVQFPTAYTAYYAKNFPGRERWIRSIYDVRLRIFEDIVYPEVLVGRQGWLYYTGEDNMDYYQQARVLTEAELQIISAFLFDTSQRVHAQGAQFIFVIAPNKETVYPDFLPEQVHSRNLPSQLDQLLMYLQSHSGMEIVDLRPVLLSARRTDLVYRVTDTHWNELGAYFAYQEIMRYVENQHAQIGFQRLESFEQTFETTRGDLSLMLPLSEPFAESVIQLNPRSPRKAQIVEDVPHQITITEINDASLQRLVVFRDSFYDALISFFSEHFQRAVYQTSFSIDYNLLAEEKPDIVILEVSERYLIRLLDMKAP